MDNLATIEFDCGELVVDSVREGRETRTFLRSDGRLKISLTRPGKVNEQREIEVAYHGTPRRGIRFFAEPAQVYTVFSTSQWLVCVGAPDDKATLRLKLIVPAQFNTVANGRPAGRLTSGGEAGLLNLSNFEARPSYRTASDNERMPAPELSFSPDSAR